MPRKCPIFFHHFVALTLDKHGGEGVEAEEPHLEVRRCALFYTTSLQTLLLLQALLRFIFAMPADLLQAVHQDSQKG